ncbi:galactose-binding domain-containing protein [Longibaculum muris]|uniref:galactose-binding domain-containing protein n=1 Tax=Longibaculum muris TaxID=1796628 RepID=UPI0022E29991|nr:discoidin domain-containing protein [Longibaculum muris]
MLKKTNKIILVLTLILSLIFGQGSVVRATSQTDMNLIKSRLKEYFLALDTIDDGAKVETCYVSQAEDYLKLINEEGAFEDVDYNAHNNAANGAAWSPYLALDRLQAIAIAYHKEGNALYHSEAAKNGLDKAIKYWSTQGKRDNKPDGPYSTNWWENEVGVPLRFSRIALFMDGIISEEAQNILLVKLKEKTPVKYGPGQNNLWFDQNWVYHALLTNDAKKLKEMVTDYLDYCLSTQEDDVTAEAVQVDNSFYMHGRQFYSNGYGMSMFRDMSFWIYMLRGTEFAISQEVVTRMGNYMLNGTSWTIRGDIMELYLGYRPYKYEVGYKNYAAEYIEPLKRMIDSDPLRANEYQKVLDNIEGKTTSNGKDGNYYMWRSGYASHMRDGYGVNVKMDSKSVIGGEWRGSWPAGKDGGQLIYWTSSAASTITVDGDEYTNVFPTYDWAHCPGTTTAARIVKDYANSGRFTNGTDHMIGVTNGKYGATSYAMNKKDTQASKGYFFFDDEFVALGAGITSKESVAINTTLNQSEADNVIVNDQAVAEGTKKKEYTTKWLYNDKVGYVFPKEEKVVVSNALQADNPSLWPEDKKKSTPATFTAWLDHGVKPVDASYAYIVVPNTTAKNVSEYANDIPVTIVSNTKEIQAVRHDGLKQTQINFYKAGTLEYKPGYTITVDQPCSVMIDESKPQREITVAANDYVAHRTVHVDLSYDEVNTSTVFTTRALPYAGQSITLSEGEDTRYVASSYTEGHSPKYVVDENTSTYWENQGNKDEWVSVFTGTDQYIKDMNILWGDQYATEYDVYISQDGEDYQLISSVKDGKGKEETINIGKICHYVKIVMKSAKDKRYQIKELTFNEGKLLSLNQPVTVSSVSTNAPTFVGSLAVDGDTSTRWASKRDSNDEWISIDLGKESNMNAVVINWEAACSDNYQIEVSSDNKNWKTVKSSLKTDQTLTDEINFDEAVTGRYIKVHSLKSRIVSGKNYGINIFEIKVYGTASNIALNKPAKARSEYSSSLSAKNAFDGSVEKTSSFQSRWASDRKHNDDWIYVDLQASYEISNIVLNWEGAYAKEYKLQVSEDAENWTDITHVTEGKVGITEFNYEEPATGRYVRMLGVEPVGGYGYSIWEFEVYGALVGEQSEPEPEEINIALNKPSKASSEYIDPNDGSKQYYSSLAFDGSSTAINGKQSRWVSNRNSNDEWIYVDLEDTYDISKIVLNWEGTSKHEYKILVSDDQETWQEVVHRTDGVGVQEIKLDELITGRYVKMQGVKVGAKYGYSLWEFEVYGELTEKPNTTNIALNKPSKASSEFIDPNDGNKQYYSSLAFDGNTDKINDQQSRWVSNRKSNDEWIYVDLQDNYYISKIVLNWEGACGKEYKLQVSNDGENWTDITHVTDGKKGITEFNYGEPATGRYVRMLGIQPVGEYGYSLWEFEVYGVSLKGDLKAYYDENKNIDTSLYTPASVSKYQEALENVIAVYKNKKATPEEILNAKEQLKNAIDSLVKKADKKALEEVINKAQEIDKELYIQDTVKELEKVLEDVKAIYEDENATQKQVDKAVEDLNAAIKTLVKKADKKALEKAIQEAKAIDTKLYTDETVEVLTAVLKEAEEIYKDEAATQETVDAIVKKLQEAVEKLEEKEVDIVVTPDKPDENKPDENKPGEPEQNNNQPTTEEKVETSDNTQYQMYIGLLGISMCAMALLINKKKKNQVK